MIFASRIKALSPMPARIQTQARDERGRGSANDRMKPLPIFWLMVAAIVTMAALAYFDEEREASASLDDFAHEQTTLAQSLAGVLSAHLTTDHQATLALAQIRATEESDRIVLLRRPGSTELETTDGRHVREPAIVDALKQGRRWLRLEPAQAGQLGLPARTALAGLSFADGDQAGLWGLAVAASAERERDRDRRARWRLILSVTTASGLVLVFGGLALRNQRKELVLKHELEFADLRAKRDERLERAGRAATMGTLAVGVAHEISTPLGIIAGRAEQLSSRISADERAASNVRIILEQTDRIHRIIRGLLGLARGDRPTAEPIEPHSLITGAIALVEHRFAKASVRLSTEVAPALPVVHGDPRLLEHAVVNLLLNACDACTSGGTVEVRAHTAQGDLQIDVLDSGPGISDANRVLEPFFSTKPRGQGTGIGLAIVQEIVASHRGSLTLESVHPHGTKATIKLPCSQESAHA
jgi:two-component system NtrC family sensor kinase